MIKAVIFDIDGTLVDSVDLPAKAWQEAFNQFGINVGFQQARDQIGKGGWLTAAGAIEIYDGPKDLLARYDRCAIEIGVRALI